MLRGNSIQNIFSIKVDYSKRIFGLDMLRALAIFLVLFAHSLVLLPSLPKALSKVLFHLLGFLGVELFFVLSGFLVGQIIIRTMDSKSGFTLATAKSFWIRRWFRTLPNYYLILASQFVLLYVLNGSIPQSYSRFLIFSQNLFMDHPPFFYEAWTLAVEEWFYLLLPVSIIACSWLLPRQLSKRVTFLVVILFYLAAGLFLRVAASLANLPEISNLGGIVMFRIDSIMYGVLFAYVYYYYRSLEERYRRPLFYLGTVLIVLCSGYLVGNIIEDKKDFFTKTFLYSFNSFGMACLLPAVNNVKKGRPGPLASAVSHLSIISYSAYLLHNSTILMFLWMTPPVMGTYHIHYLLFWILSILCSTALYKSYERPMTLIRDRFS
ncbi:MAG: acyltransferase [Nitrospirae bacterium]|nr:MAG: acyltransferase [Nitrospirota bacterium]